MTLSSWALGLWSCAWTLFLLANTSRIGGEADSACTLKNDDDDTQEIICRGYGAAAAFYSFAFVAAAAATASTFFEQIIGQRSFLLLALSLGLYGIALTAELGAQSDAVCDLDADDDSVATFCGGYGAAATFYCFAAIVAFVLAYFARNGLGKETIYHSAVTFYTFLAVYALAWMTQLATQAHSGCETVEDDKAMSIAKAKASVAQCNGYGFSTFTAFLMMCAAIAAIVNTVRNKFEDDDSQYHQQYMNWFSIFLPFLFGTLVNYGVEAQISCQINSKSNDDDDNECSGNASAAVFATLAVLVAVLGVVGTHHQKLQMRNTTWLMSWALFFLAYTCFLGGESSMNCEQQDDTDDKDAEDAYGAVCNGYGVATFFMFIGFLITLAAIFFEFRAHPGNDFFEIRFHPADQSSGPAFTPIPEEGGNMPEATAEPFYEPQNQFEKQGGNSFDTADL